MSWDNNDIQDDDNGHQMYQGDGMLVIYLVD